MLSTVEPALYLAFLGPLSRKNEPRMMALDTVAAARISEEAKTVRYCWRPRLWITSGIRAPVIPIRMMDMEKRVTSDTLRLNGIPERTMMGIGKQTRRMSVMMSAMPMVSR